MKKGVGEEEGLSQLDQTSIRKENFQNPGLLSLFLSLSLSVCIFPLRSPWSELTALLPLAAKKVRTGNRIVMTEYTYHIPFPGTGPPAS
jgi:hypothetical protein